MSSPHPYPRFVEALLRLNRGGALSQRVCCAADALRDVDATLVPDHHRVLLRRLVQVSSPAMVSLEPLSADETRFWARWITETTLDLAREGAREAGAARRHGGGLDARLHDREAEGREPDARARVSGAPGP